MHDSEGGRRADSPHRFLSFANSSQAGNEFVNNFPRWFDVAHIAEGLACEAEGVLTAGIEQLLFVILWSVPRSCVIPV